MAEWSCSGLQLRVRRFDSDSSLHNFLRPSARVVKLVDTRDLKSLALTSVPVRVRLRAPLFCFKPLIIQGFFVVSTVTINHQDKDRTLSLSAKLSHTCSLTVIWLF